MWIVRDKRRDEIPDVPQEVGAGLGCLRVMGASGNTIVDVEGLEESALVEAEALSGCGLSQFVVVCLRDETGLIEEALDAARRPGDEDQ